MKEPEEQKWLDCTGRASGERTGYVSRPLVPCKKQGLRDAWRTCWPVLLWCVKYVSQAFRPRVQDSSPLWCCHCSRVSLSCVVSTEYLWLSSEFSHTLGISRFPVYLESHPPNNLGHSVWGFCVESNHLYIGPTGSMTVTLAFCMAIKQCFTFLSPLTAWMIPSSAASVRYNQDQLDHDHRRPSAWAATLGKALHCEVLFQQTIWNTFLV